MAASLTESSSRADLTQVTHMPELVCFRLTWSECRQIPDLGHSQIRIKALRSRGFAREHTDNSMTAATTGDDTPH